MLSTRRKALGPAPSARLRVRLPTAVDAEHRDHDDRAVRVGDSGHGLRLGLIDGSVTRFSDTPRNWKASARPAPLMARRPYPRVRNLLASDASTRVTLAVTSGSLAAQGRGRAGAAGYYAHRLPADLSARTGSGPLDRNFPVADRVARMLATGTHVLIRVKSDLVVPRVSGFLPDSSYLTSAGGHWCPKVRIIEYQVSVDGQGRPRDVLPDHRPAGHLAYPAPQLAAAYVSRRTGCETSLKEAKSAITGADPAPACLPLRRPWADHAGTRRLDLWHRVHPRPGPHRRPPGRPRLQGPPRRQNQSPPGLLRRRARHHHPHRDRAGQHLPADSGLTHATPASCQRPVPETRRTWNRPPPERKPGHRPANHAP